MRSLLFLPCLVLLALPARAQDNKVAIPFSSASQPRKVVIESMNGNVTVRGYSGQEVTIESTGGTPVRKGQKEPPPGMHRIGPVADGFTATEANNTIRINTGVFGGRISMVVQVPTQTSVSVKLMGGRELIIENVSGEIEASNMNGAVNIVNVSGSVVAHSANGKVTASLASVTPDKAMSFSTFNGDIDVTLPASIKANFKMKTDRGDMFTDFDVQVSAPKTTTETKGRTVRVRTDRTTTGTVNGGGPEIQFTSFNGDILIHKK